MKSLAFLGLLALSSGCSEEAAGAEGEGEGESHRRSIRRKLETHRPLLAEAVRAELDAGGLLIDLGTAEQQKFTRGGWNTGWGRSRVAKDGATFAEVARKAVQLDTLIRNTAIQEVQVRLRSKVAGQRVAVSLGGKELGHDEVGTGWTVAKIAVSSAITAGAQTLQLLFGSGAKVPVRAEVDWVWLRTGGSEQPPPVGIRVMPLRIGKAAKRALVAPTARSYIYYLHLPEQASLVFDYGTNQESTFAVRVEPHGGAAKEIFRSKAVAGEWREAHVPLDAYAGQAVRLELIAEGKPGVAGFGEPEIMVSPRATTQAGVVPPGRPAKNVIVILIDTVRADVFSAFNPKSDVYTPEFDKLVADSAVFPTSYANENWTKPSVATVLTGLYPATHGTKQEKDKLAEEVVMLSERLQNEGFATAGFIANGYCSDKFGFRQGWDTYKNYIRESKPSQAQYVYGDGLEWIKENRQKRFFLYLQTIDPHVPYRKKDKYISKYHSGPYSGPVGGASLSGGLQAQISQGKKKVGPADYDWIRALYYSEVSHHDEHMGKFLAELQAMGLLDDTLIVVTNDHGEELNDHGRLGHGHSLYEDLLRAPLLMRYPPVFPAGTRIDHEIAENVDIFPTVLEVLGLRPARDIDGLSLLPVVAGTPPLRPTYAVSEFLEVKRSVRVGRFKLMRSTGTWMELYDIERDREEKNNLKDSAPVARRLCEVYLAEALASPNKAKRQQNIVTQRRFKGGKATIDPELRKQLEALGYFGG